MGLCVAVALQLQAKDSMHGLIICILCFFCTSCNQRDMFPTKYDPRHKVPSAVTDCLQVSMTLQGMLIDMQLLDKLMSLPMYGIATVTMQRAKSRHGLRDCKCTPTYDTLATTS